MPRSGKHRKPVEKNPKTSIEIPEKFRHIDIDSPHPLLDMMPEDSGWFDVIERQQAATPEQEEEAAFISRMRFLRAKKKQQHASRGVSRLVKKLTESLSDHEICGLDANDPAELAAQASGDADSSQPPFASAPLLVDEEAIIATIAWEGSGDVAEFCCANRHSFLRLLRFCELYEGGTLGELSAGQLRNVIVLMDAFETGLLSGEDFADALNTMWRYSKLCDVYSVLELMHSAGDEPIRHREEFRATRDDIDHPSSDLGVPPVSAEEREDFLRFLSSRYGALWVTWNPTGQRSAGD